MKRRMSALVGMLVLLAGVATGSATTISDYAGGEEDLYQIYNHIYGTAYTDSNQLTQVSDNLDNLWVETTGAITLEVRNAAYSQGIGVSYGGNDYLIDVGVIAPGYNGEYPWVSIDIPENTIFSWFELYDDSGRWYSDDSLNASGSFDHFIALETLWSTTNHPQYLLCFEDTGAGSDMDYNDLVVKVKYVSPVPEPSILILLGGGLAGIGLLRRRRRIV